MSVFSYPKSPEELSTFDEPSVKRLFRSLATILNRVLVGKINAVVEVTLTANAATTTLTDARLTINSFIAFDPVTANAAAELAAGTLYVLSANRRNGAFTLTHSNAVSADRSYKAIVIG